MRADTLLHSSCLLCVTAQQNEQEELHCFHPFASQQLLHKLVMQCLIIVRVWYFLCNQLIYCLCYDHIWNEAILVDITIKLRNV